MEMTEKKALCIIRSEFKIIMHVLYDLQVEWFVLFVIFLLSRNFEFLIPDAPELIANFLESEQDMSCKRNAFLMLLHADQERALTFLASRLDQVSSFGDILQLVIVELIYKVS